MNNKDFQVFEKMVKYANEIDKTLTEYNLDHELVVNSSTARNSISMCILQIGELVGHLHYETIESFQNIPWKQIRSMRNIAAHDYGRFDVELLWTTATVDIPELKRFCLKVLEET